MTKIIFND